MQILGIADYGALVASTTIFLMLPGPGTFAILTAAARGGRAGGFAALAGLIAGDWLLMAAAVTGLAALLAAHPAALGAVQWAGVVYLGWVGLGLVFARSGAAGATLLPMGHARFLRQAFLITLVNPKAIVFYMAFFPLFIDPSTHRGAATFMAMGATISLLTLAYGSALVLAGNAAARRLGRRAGLATLARRTVGVVLIGFGVRMAGA